MPFHISFYYHINQPNLFWVVGLWESTLLKEIWPRHGLHNLSSNCGLLLGFTLVTYVCNRPQIWASTQAQLTLLSNIWTWMDWRFNCVRANNISVTLHQQAWQALSLSLSTSVPISTHKIPWPKIYSELNLKSLKLCHASHQWVHN